MSRTRQLLALAVGLCVATAGFARSPAASGEVTIRYTFSRLFRVASNQYAIWIEDENGVFVRTLFATSYVAKRAGWKVRPQAVPTWIDAAGIKGLPQKEVDAVSGATPANGSHQVVWDLRDSRGRLVSPGTYRYRVEGNLFWENRVLWTGEIVVGSHPQSTVAQPVYSPAEAQNLDRMLSEVTATYTPGE